MHISFFVLIILLVLSCGASHHLKSDLIYKDNDFSYDHLKKKGMIIAGISSKMIEFNHEKRLEYGKSLSNVLLDKLKDVYAIHIINTQQFISRIGTLKYFDTMEEFDRENVLSENLMQNVRDTIPDIQYLIIGYIENENIMDDKIEEYVENEDGKEVIQTEYEKTYLLTVQFQIYDIIEGKKSWETVIYNKAKHSETRETRSGCMESCIDNIFLSLLHGEAAEISREEVLVRIFERLAKNLSKS